MSNRPSNDSIQQWIHTVNDFGRHLTDWEVNFMESITYQFELSGSLSEGQIEILERIYAEKTR